MGRKQKYKVELELPQREWLFAFLKKGTAQAREIKRANILLLAGGGKLDKEISEILHVSVSTVANVRKRFVDEGLERALHDLPRPGGKPKLDVKGEARLVALACSSPPDGRVSWTMKLLADKLIEQEIIDGISDETVRRTLKKTTSNRGRKNTGVLVK